LEQQSQQVTEVFDNLSAVADFLIDEYQP